MLDLSGQQAAFDAARKRHNRFVIQTFVALVGLSWIAMWLVTGDFGNGSIDFTVYIWRFVLAIGFCAALWYTVGYGFVPSKPVALRIARLAMVAHAAWFAIGVGLVFLGLVMAGFAMSAGHFALGPLFGVIAFAVILAGPILAFMVSFRMAGAIADLCDIDTAADLKRLG